MQTELQMFLAERSDAFKHLTEVLAISMKQHPDYPNLYMFNYSQIDSPMGNPIVQECRGSILDSKANWRPVCMTYKKFFNYGEGHAAELGGPLKRYMKMDGSLMQLYYYDKKWHVASSGSPNAGGALWDSKKKLSDLFWETFEAKGMRLPDLVDRCFAFELTGPHNKIVVRYPENDLQLHGVRNLVTMQEEPPEKYGERYNWKVVKFEPAGNPEDVVQQARELNALHEEGYVLVDERFNRVKVKCPQYVAMHNLKSSMSQRNLLEIVRSNENGEFLVYFPEYEKEFLELKGKYDSFIAEAEKVWEEAKGIEGQWNFANAINKHSFSSALFQVRAGKYASIREFFKGAKIRSLEQWLGLKS